MQDRAIKDIGKLEFEKNSNLKPYELFTQEPYPNKVCKMLLIEFEMKQSEIYFKGIDIDNVNEQNYSKYAYRKGSSRGGDITFTTKFGDLDKKLNTLINTQFPNLIGLSKKEEPNYLSFYKDWRNSFVNNYDKLKAELQDTYDNQEKEDKLKSAFTLTIYINGKRKLLSEFKSVQELIAKNGIEGNYKKHGVESKGKNQECSVCHKVKTEVYGFGSPFKYSTVDKTGTVSSFFNQKKNWINYPICESCAIEMELGKNYITKYLSKYFFGKRYFLIPKTVLPQDTESLDNALSIFSGIDYQLKNSESISSKEDFLMEKIGKISNNVFTLNLLFFEENPTTKAIKIKIMLEEIPPSRFRKLFIDVPKIVNNNPLFKDIDYHYKKKQKQDLRFSFRLIKQFFNDNFYEMTYKIFMGKRINESELHKRFMEVIRANYINKVNNEGFVENGDLLIAKCFLIQNYFKEINMINTNNKKINMVTDEEKEEIVRKVSFDFKKLKRFVKENERFGEQGASTGIFGLGVLVHLVFSMQQASLNSTPFEKKLKGLHLTPRDIERIFTEAVEKINQYSYQNTYKELRELIANNLSSNKKKILKMSNQEISFNFVCGLELGKKFKS